LINPEINAYINDLEGGEDIHFFKLKGATGRRGKIERAAKKVANW
jgi:hypothetical protein